MPSTSFELFPQHLQLIKAALDPLLARYRYDALVVHSGAPLYRFLDDMEYPFKVNPHFSWWVPEAVPQSVLVYKPGSKPRLFYFQPVDYWHLPPAPPDPAWAEAFDLVLMDSAEGWREQIKDDAHLAVLGNAPVLKTHFAQAALNPAALLHEVDLCRSVKTPYEQDCLARANQRAARGHEAARRAYTDGASEFETHLAYMRATAHGEHELPYSNIIAQNQHGGVLHYHGLDREPPAPRRSFLIDAGASYNGYAADITRTYTADDSGLFKDLIGAMEAAQLELVDGVRAGTDYRDLHLQAHQHVATILNQAGIVRMAPAAMVECGLSAAFFPHGLGHYLGLQVHDVGGLLADEVGVRIERPEGHPFLRLTRPLAAGNVLTVEPGLYFIPQLLDPWREKAPGRDAVDWDLVAQLLPYGGIRIEDDVLVQAEGAPRNFSREAFAALH